MTDYIKREDAIRSIADHDEFKGERWIKEAWADYMIEDAKPADVAPVRHGHWIKKSIYDSVCSVCGADESENIYGTEMWYGEGESRYCPECGARMDGENDE